MRFRLLFADPSGEGPELMDAIDEITEDAWGGLPDFYKAKMTAETRELFIDIPDSAIEALFDAPTVECTILPHEDTGGAA